MRRNTSLLYFFLVVVCFAIGCEQKPISKSKKIPIETFKESLTELCKPLKSKNAVDRTQAAWLLGQLNDYLKVVVPRLVEALQDSDTEVINQSLRSLGSFGVNSEEAIPAIVKIFQREEPLLIQTAIYALEAINPTYKKLEKYLPEVKKLTQHKNPEVCLLANRLEKRIIKANAGK